MLVEALGEIDRFIRVSGRRVAATVVTTTTGGGVGGVGTAVARSGDFVVRRGGGIAVVGLEGVVAGGAVATAAGTVVGFVVVVVVEVELNGFGIGLRGRAVFGSGCRRGGREVRGAGTTAAGLI